ncbi:MAG: WG repeat-containing protein [Bacteroidaceae bacterium]|nr:WG repeat-containing protein [Bacteroidaceae bacterium]
MKTYCRFVSAVALLSLVACNSKQVECFPTKNGEDDFWGVVELNGKELLSNEFENRIVGINDGVLLTQDEYGMFQFYLAEKNPRPIGGEFVSAGDFCDGIAPVVKEGEWIKFIDKKGQIVFELKEIDNKQVDWISNFHFGIAIYRLEDDTYGLIDTKGKVLVKPQKESIHFCMTKTGIVKDGLLMVYYEDSYILINSKDFINGDKNKALNKFEYNKSEIYFFDHSEYYCTSTEKELQVVNKGKVLLTVPKDSKVQHIYDIMEEHLLFVSSDNKCGVMNIRGNVLIRPKYQLLGFMGKECLICSTNSKKFKVIDIDDEVINDEIPMLVGFLYLNDGISCFIEQGEETPKCYFVNEKGKSINKKTYCDIDFRPRNELTSDGILSNYFYPSKIIKQLNIRENGIGYISVDSPMSTFLEVSEKFGGEHEPEDYLYRKTMEFYDRVDDQHIEYVASFREVLAKYYEDYGASWTYCDLDHLIAQFYLDKELIQKGELIFNAIYEYYASKCTFKYKGTKNAIFRLKDSKDVILLYDKDENAIKFVFLTYEMPDEIVLNIDMMDL